MRRGCLVWSVLVVAGIITPAAAHAQEDTLLVDAVVRLDILDGPEAIVEALSYNSTILVPVRRFLAMSETRMAHLDAGDSLVAVIEPGSIPVTFLTAASQLRVGPTTFDIPAIDMRWRGTELFVATTVLDQAFGVSTVMDWATLTTQVRATASLPYVRRVRRERRRGLMRSREPPRPMPARVRPDAGLADGAVVEWSLRGATDQPFEDYSADVGVGARLFDGSFELRQRSDRMFGRTNHETRVSWERAWTDSRYVRQVRIGDVLSNGRRARLVQGVAVTNAPFVRSSEFDLDAVIGQLPAGWEVELYDRGILGGFVEADAVDVYRLPLELRYGSNPFDLVFYGPAGEVIREERTIRIPQSRLPNGKFEYAVAGGRCRFEPCKALVSSDVRYGLNGRVTLQGGVDGFATNQGSIIQPYAIVAATPWPAIHTTGEIVLQGHLRGAVDYEPSTDLRISASHTIFDDDGSVVTPRSLQRHRADASMFWRPRRGMRNLSLMASVFVAGGNGARQNGQRVSARWRAGAFQYDAGLRHEYFGRNGATLTQNTAVDLGTWANLSQFSPVFRETTARASTSLDFGRGLDALQLNVGRQIKRMVRVDVGMGWYRIGGARLEIRLNTLLRGPRVGTFTGLSGRGVTRSSTTFDGSMVVDPGTGMVQFGDGRDLGRAGLAGTVFLDDNANGVRDPGEQGLEDVGVLVGEWPDLSDQDGRFAAWNLTPYEPTIIEVDTMGFEDPRYVAPRGAMSVTAVPNSFLAIDIPIVLGAEVGGFVVLDGETVAGAPVQIRNLRTGDVINLQSFADGGFYKVGVPPGDYEVRIPPETLDALGATSFPVEITIPAGELADAVQWDDIVLRIRREPGQQ